MLLMKAMPGEREAGETDLPRDGRIARLEANQAAPDEKIGALDRGEEFASSKKHDAN